jgi:hypothetical protein
MASSAGTVAAHRSSAWTQRVRKAQPEGTAVGLGGSPRMAVVSSFCPAARVGAAESKSRVYG